MTKNSFAFEQSLAELETLVRKMESGEMSLEASLTAFEQGIRLTRDCQNALANAEQKVQKLISQNGVLTTEPFDQEDKGDSASLSETDSNTPGRGR